MKEATGSKPSIASPLNRLTTTLSVVAAWAATPAKPANPGTPGPRAAHTEIKAIPRPGTADRSLPFLSCRCAVIVDADKFESRGHILGARLEPCCWRQVKAAAGISTSGVLL